MRETNYTNEKKIIKIYCPRAIEMYKSQIRYDKNMY